VILVVNAGSSSLKLRLLGPGDEVLASHDLPALDAGGEEGLRRTLRDLGGVTAVGHRVVHGGARFHEAVVVDDAIVAQLERLTDLAPLHQPAALAALAAARAAAPGVPHVACFDTAFHAGLPAAAATYAVPREWRERHGVRRYGFHGLSHAYASRRAGELLEDPSLRIVSCHLGAGASLCAVADGRSVDTTMGFTPLEGVVMATRAGSIDPGIGPWLEQHAGLSAADVGDALERRSGLVALAGTPDMQALLQAAGEGDADACLARDVYVHRLRGFVAAMAASLGGLDALVFTAGVGEHAAQIRRRTADGLGFLGVTVDAAANAGATPDVDISAPGSTVRTLVITAREDLEIARQVRQAARGSSTPAGSARSL
jgi:acetate kinase